MHPPRPVAAGIAAAVLALTGCAAAQGTGPDATTTAAPAGTRDLAPTTTDPSSTIDVAGTVVTPTGEHATGTGPVVPRRRVAVVGDSLTNTAAPELRRQLAEAGWEVVTVDGTLGVPIADRVALVQDLVRNGRLDAIVLALGSNDARLNIDTGRDVATAWANTQSAAFTALAEAQVVPCVVWIGVNANTDTWKLDQWGAWFNAWLRYYVHYGDWTAASAGRPEWFLADDVHLTPEGNAAYAALMVDTLARDCVPADG